MSIPFDFRPLLAATVLLAVLAGAYGVAVRGPLSSPGSKTAHLRNLSSRADNPTDNSAARSAKAASPPVAPTPVSIPPVPAAPRPTEDAEPPPPKCRPLPLRFVAKRRAGPRRYVGTVGGERATAEISWMRPDSATGSFYLWRGGLEYQLETTRRRRGALALALSQEEANTARPRGTWRLATPPGPVLRGTWVDAAGRARPFALREDYRQAVAYDIQSLMVSGGMPATDDCRASSLTRDYLHLRGNLRPAWQRLQAPALATRKRRLLADYERAGDISYFLAVRLNGFDLVSYQTFYEAFPIGGPRQNDLESGLIDLATGRALPLASQLQANYQPVLRRLLLRHLLRDLKRANGALGERDGAHYQIDSLAAQELSLSSLVLTGAGLEAGYFPEELYTLFSPAVTVYSIPYTVLLPYAELRPLVRPGTPLARMLRARGLW